MRHPLSVLSPFLLSQVTAIFTSIISRALRMKRNYGSQDYVAFEPEDIGERLLEPSLIEGFFMGNVSLAIWALISPVAQAEYLENQTCAILLLLTSIACFVVVDIFSRLIKVSVYIFLLMLSFYLLILH